MASTLKLDWPALWKSVPASMVEAAAQQVAASVDVGSVTEAEVGVMMGTTKYGAPVALVTIKHPAGLAMQAKHGTLTKAAASVGLEVHGGGDGLVEYVSKAGKKSRITQLQADNYNRKKTS